VLNGGGGFVAGDDVIDGRRHDSPPSLLPLFFGFLIFNLDLEERRPLRQLVGGDAVKHFGDGAVEDFAG